jgi:hypothetical protein
MHPHRMDDRGAQCKIPVGNHGCLTHMKKHGIRQLPLGPVVVSSRCLRLVSAPPWEHLPPLIHAVGFRGDRLKLLRFLALSLFD